MKRSGRRRRRLSESEITTHPIQFLSTTGHHVSRPFNHHHHSFISLINNDTQDCFIKIFSSRSIFLSQKWSDCLPIQLLDVLLLVLFSRRTSEPTYST